MTLVLDCESRESTLNSLSAILHCSPVHLESTLRQFDLEGYLRANPRRDYAPRELVWNQVVGVNVPVPIPDAIYWFHATRVLPATRFEEGLQPLGERVTKLTAFITKLAEQSGISISDSQGRNPSLYREQGSYHYGAKVHDRRHWGPYAFLVRDAILHRDSITHDYLATPEIVEDFAGLLAGDDAPQLLKRFRELTRPCIVKFVSTTARDDVVRVALYYLYREYWGLEQYTETNTCFDGEGQTVSRDAIVNIEFLHEPPSS
jgi:hypothetical protein